MEIKLNWKDRVVICCLSLLLAVPTFFYAIGYLYNPKSLFFFKEFYDFIFELPFYLLSPLYLLTDNSGSALGMGILFEKFSLLLAFIFWFLIFYLLAKMSKNFFSTSKIFTTNMISIIFVGLLGLGFGFYTQGLSEFQKYSSSFGSNPDGKIISINKSAKIGDQVTISLLGFARDGYSYVTLTQNVSGGGYSNKGTLWVGKVPDNNVISFVLPRKVCRDIVSSCADTPTDFINLLPGNYVLHIWSGADNINLSSDFKVEQ